MTKYKLVVAIIQNNTVSIKNFNIKPFANYKLPIKTFFCFL